MSEALTSEHRAELRRIASPDGFSPQRDMIRLLDALEESEEAYETLLAMRQELRTALAEAERERDMYRSIAAQASETAGNRVRQLEQICKPPPCGCPPRLCLVCGASEPCQTEADANGCGPACTFDPTYSQLIEMLHRKEQECTALRAAAIHATETAREQAQQLIDVGTDRDGWERSYRGADIIISELVASGVNIEAAQGRAHEILAGNGAQVTRTDTAGQERGE